MHKSKGLDDGTAIAAKCCCGSRCHSTCMLLLYMCKITRTMVHVWAVYQRIRDDQDVAVGWGRGVQGENCS